MNKRLYWLCLSLLGFAAACDENNKQTEMYGCPNLDFRIKGKVTDVSGNPIPGIAVQSAETEVHSQADGKYEISGNNISKEVILRFTDTDGAANGGDFAEQTASVRFTDADRTAKGDGNWYQGTYAREDANVALSEKK